jgi:tetratricopeptide (TPR) repeat protein
MDTFNDIARYAEGEMTADERAVFETSLASDESLRKQLALYQEVHVSLQQHFIAGDQQIPLQDTMQSLRSEFFGAASQPAKVISFKRYLRSAVAVAAILIAVIIIWQPWKPGLYKEFSETSMAAPAERGSTANDLLQQAVDAFNKKDYASAASLLQQVKQQDTANSFVNFYYGVALLQTDRLPEARLIFNQLYAGQSAFKFEAAFYQALGYLKEDNKEPCREWLQKIPADAPNYTKAQELLNKLGA